ncbi:hypothetical protein ACEPPN_009530 [Leptodophora sp. 'Broadleaf-Isolate-01']
MTRSTNDSLKPHEAVTDESGDHGKTIERVAKLDTMRTRHGGKHIASVDSLQSRDDTLAGWIDGTAIQKTTDSHGDNASQEHTGFAWSLYHHTLELFSLLLLPTLAHVATFTPPYEKQGEKSFKKSLGRLYLWGGGFSGGKLESVLDESESLRGTVVESLAAIGKILLFKLAAKRSAHSDAPDDPRIKQEIRDLSVLVEKARIITDSDYESDESSASTDAPQDDSFDWEDVDNQQSQPIDFQISGPAQPYVLKVYDKFPLADMHLMHRLGEANWQRHMSLRAMGDEEEVEQFPQELPKITFVAVSEFQDSGLGSSLPERSTYTATVASHSSFQTTADEKDSGSLRVPATPKQVSDGEPFSCQICGQFLSNIRNRVDWRRHVFADLKPYLCTFLGCKDEFKMFTTRKLWEEHEFGQHRLNRYWACSTCQHRAKSPEDWRAHLVQAHNFPLSDGQYALDARLVEVREPVPIKSLSCPLCLEVPGKSQRHFATHVGKHMEGIALAALPRDEESTDTESMASNMSDASGPSLTDYPSSQENVSWTLEQPGQEDIGWKRGSSQGYASFTSGLTGGVHPALMTEVESPLPSQWESAPSMGCTTSRENPSQRSNVPFTQAGAMPPQLNSDPFQENPAIMDRGPQIHLCGVEDILLLDDMGETPGDFIGRTIGTGISPTISVPSSTSINNDHQPLTTTAAETKETVQRLSEGGFRLIQENILKPLLKYPSINRFHPLVEVCSTKIQANEILCLRDLEKFLLVNARTNASSTPSYLDFMLVAVQHIQVTARSLSERDQIRLGDRPYTEDYFAALVEQIRQQHRDTGPQVQTGPISQRDSAVIYELTSRLMSQVSEDEKNTLRTTLQQRMDPTQLNRYQAQGVDPVFLYYRNQAMSRLRQERKKRLQEAQAEAAQQQEFDIMNAQTQISTEVGGIPNFGSFTGNKENLAARQQQNQQVQFVKDDWHTVEMVSEPLRSDSALFPITPQAQGSSSSWSQLPGSSDFSIHQYSAIYREINDPHWFPKPGEPIQVKMGGKPFLVTGHTEVSSSTGEEDNISAARRLPRSLSEEADDDEDILRIMARRKKNAATAELAPKKCKEPGCDKEFKRACDLTKHEKIHSRPWECPVHGCKYFGLPTEKEMNKHNKEMHSITPPFFQCHFKPCPYQSKRESNCKQHMERTHGLEFVRSKITIKRRTRSTVTQLSTAKLDMYAPINADDPGMVMGQNGVGGAGTGPQEWEWLTKRL